MPNIFEYATSELSQDAMIAWLMACAHPKEEDAALREVGRSFIRFLLKMRCNDLDSAVLDGDGKLMGYDGAGVVSEVCNLDTQYNKVDVYCRAKIDGRLVSFVIEDKTGTTHHSGQLDRYRRMAQSDSHDEHYLKLIYLKTGMPFPDELDAAARAHFCHVGVKELNRFLNSEMAIAASSDLLQQYRTHISKLAHKQKKARRNWNMDCGPIQYTFAKELKQRTKANAGEVIWKWRNRGGGYWTQYRFFGLHLFWRMDTGGDLRMMVDVRQPKPSNVDVYEYQKAFLRTCHGLVKPAKFNFRRGKEMTVGAIPYPKGREIGEDAAAYSFLDAIAQVHERFLQELAKLRADNATS